MNALPPGVPLSRVAATAGGGKLLWCHGRLRITDGKQDSGAVAIAAGQVRVYTGDGRRLALQGRGAQTSSRGETREQNRQDRWQATRYESASDASEGPIEAIATGRYPAAIHVAGESNSRALVQKTL